MANVILYKLKTFTINSHNSRFLTRQIEDKLNVLNILPTVSKVRRVSNTTAALQQRRASLATSVAFHSLLYHLCSFYESNPARRESLFEVSAKF